MWTDIEGKEMPRPIALIVSDLHLSYKRPLCREDDWMAFQNSILKKVTCISLKYGIPILCAGDIFHTPKEPPSVEALAVHWMKKNPWYAVPGQHDLPNHSLSLINESSFGVLVESGMVHFCAGPIDHLFFFLVGFPFGSKPVPLESFDRLRPDKPSIAMGHELVWEEKPYPGAPLKGKVQNIAKKYKGFDLLIFGDNHNGFQKKIVSEKTTVLVPGCASKRKRTERTYRPSCWLLFDDISIKRIRLPKGLPLLNPGKDIHSEDFEDFVTSLQDQVEVNSSFLHTLDVYLRETKDVLQETKDLLFSIMESRNERKRSRH